MVCFHKEFVSCLWLSFFLCIFFFFFKQKTAYEMRISDWSSDVCSSDLRIPRPQLLAHAAVVPTEHRPADRERLEHGAAESFGPSRQLQDEVAGGVGGCDLAGRRGDRHRGRSEERRGGKACVSTCRSRWSPQH